MKQYCRYCSYLFVGNGGAWCDVRQQHLKESYCKRPNNCTEFKFCDVDSEYQDAFGETHGYHPREPKQKECDGQLNLFEKGNPG